MDLSRWRVGCSPRKAFAGVSTQNPKMATQSSNNQLNGSTRIRELDGLRALAILLVVMWHYLGLTGGPHSTQWNFFRIGITGVDLFFVLSGYLIAGILLKNAGAANYFSTFYLRRSFRILPIYFGMVAIYLAGRQLGGAQVLFDGTVPWWSYVLGVQNIWMTIHKTFGAAWLSATWSLAVEEQFYLLFPLLVYLVTPRTLMRTLVALIVLCPLGRILAFSLGDEYGYYMLTPLRADILAIGALIACLEFYGAITPGIRKAVRVVFWSAACFLPVFAWGSELSTFKMAVWGHTYLVALYGSALFMVLENRDAPYLAPLRSRLASFIARISYALYLVHIPILILTFAVVRSAPTQNTLGGMLLTACAFALSLVICWLSWRLIEGPLIRISHDRFRYVDKPQKSVSEALQRT
jgi:peptidoglycan/LPS O-acetylase OafA/YrhL